MATPRVTSLADLLVAGDDIAVYSGDEEVTRTELLGRADDYARTVEAGTAVPVSLPNGVDLVAALFGVWRAGAVYVPVNPRLTESEVERIHRSIEGRYEPDIALIQFTSGTTGPPKPVLLRHSGVLTLLDGVIGALRTTPGDRPPMPNLVPVSLSLWAGIYQVLFAFRVGAPVVLMDGFATREFARLVRQFEIRSTVLPPAAMTMLADDTSIDELAPLKYVRSITAPLSPLQARRFSARFGVTILNSYGQTEIGGEIVGWTAADAKAFGDTKLGAAGRPHQGVIVRRGEAGELQVRTPALSAGYANGIDLSDRMTADGWFRTGDVGRVDDDGFVWVEGRLSDMINRGGLKVFPDEVEEVLRLDPAVRDAAVVGADDERLGEVPHAFVVGDAIDLDGLLALCRQHLAPYKVPLRIEIVPDLPRNEIGKLLRAKLGR